MACGLHEVVAMDVDAVVCCDIGRVAVLRLWLWLVLTLWHELPLLLLLLLLLRL
jgi:hypothetical protein